MPSQINTLKQSSTTHDLVAYSNATILTSDNKTLTSGTILIKDTYIVDVMDDKEALNKYPNAYYIDCSEFLITPGFINSHTHAPLAFFRGLGHETPEMIENFLFPAEKNLTPELLEPLSYSYIYGGLRSGTTCFSDHYYFVEGVGSAIEKFKLRGVLGETIADLGGAFPGLEGWRRAQKLIENWNFSSRLTPSIAPHATDTVSKNLLTELATYAKKEDLPIHMHLSQTAGEMERTTKRECMTPVRYAEECGALGEKTLAVHLVSATDDDIKILKKTNTTVALCPTSQIIYENLAPIDKFAKAKLKMTIATDCGASNDSADLISEAKITGVFAKHLEVPSKLVSSKDLLSMITKNPAQCLGITNVGQIKQGLKADLVFFKKDLDTLPIEKPEVNLFYSFSQNNIQHVMVDGDWGLWNKQPCHISTSDMQEAYNEAVKEIKRRIAL